MAIFILPYIKRMCKKYKCGYRKSPFNEDYFGLEYEIFDLEFPYHSEELKIHHFDKPSKLKEDMEKICKEIK